MAAKKTTTKKAPDTTPRKAYHPDSLRRYLQNPEHREILKSILREPVFIAAMNALEEESREEIGAMKAAPSEMVARQSAYHLGVSGVYDRLSRLTKISEPVREQAAWDHLTPQP